MSGLSSNPLPRRRPRLLWGVLEEHLDDAAFLWKQRSRALLSLDDSLSELEQGDEGRVLAHLEGLVLGGEPVARRLLVPALEAEEPDRVAAAAWALLSQDGDTGLQAIINRLMDAPSSRPGLLQALELSERPGLDTRIRNLFHEVDPGLQAQLLEVLAFRGADASAALERGPLKGEDPIFFVAALRAARASSRSVAERWLRHGLEDARFEVRNAALEAGLVHNSRAAWAACRRCVELRAPEPRPALLALAMSGSTRDLELLIEAVADPALQAEALWALGFSGRRVAAEAALSILRSRGDPLAAWAFASITGLPVDELLVKEESSPEVLESGGDEEALQEGPFVRESLPGLAALEAMPRVDVAEAWWSERRDRFEPGWRYWRGQPWTAELLLSALHEEPMRIRPILAWELAIRSRGVCQLEPKAWAHVQRRKLREAHKRAPEIVPHGFEGWMRSWAN